MAKAWGGNEQLMKVCFGCPSASLWAGLSAPGMDWQGCRGSKKGIGEGGMEWSWSGMNRAAGEALLDVALKGGGKARSGGAFVTSL